MEAPDKIYLWETLIVNDGYDPAWHKNSFNEGDVEYIRKDALLEWLESKIKISDDSFVNGLIYLAYQNVIEHINEM